MGDMQTDTPRKYAEELLSISPPHLTSSDLISTAATNRVVRRESTQFAAAATNHSVLCSDK